MRKMAASDPDSHQTDLVQRQFGATAADYVSSPVHASGRDLEQLVRWAEGGPDKTLLDVATGGGHTALAMASKYGHVVAADITNQMLDAAREFIEGKGVANVTFVVTDAQNLAFPDQSFDAVTCRIAPHHFPRPARFVCEVGRVLKPGGIFLLEDNIVPEEARLAGVLNDVEKLRDPSHVRDLPASEWLALLDKAGLVTEERASDRKRHDLQGWLDRARTPDQNREEINRAFLDAGTAALDEFVLELDIGGRVIAFTDDKLLVKARKPGTTLGVEFGA
jgi:SAM-dependent methyltransferase